MNMIEKVMEAIADKMAPAIDVKAPYAKVMFKHAAKAAIKAMREPTEEMRKYVDDFTTEDNYQKWIDGALKETK